MGVLMKTEVPGYSAKDIECCINVDRTIEAKRSNGRGVKIGILNSINVDSIKAYCEHGIFQVLGETEPPFMPRAVAVDIAGPSEDAEKQNAQTVGRHDGRRRPGRRRKRRGAREQERRRRGREENERLSARRERYKRETRTHLVAR